MLLTHAGPSLSLWTAVVCFCLGRDLMGDQKVTRRLKRSIGELHHMPSVSRTRCQPAACAVPLPLLLLVLLFTNPGPGSHLPGPPTSRSQFPTPTPHPGTPLASPDTPLAPHPSSTPLAPQGHEGHHVDTHATAAEKEHAERNRVKNIQVCLGGLS